MKKDVTETREFCDFCEEPAGDQCLVCRKDLCRKHRLVLEMYLERRDQVFRAALCLDDGLPLLPILNVFLGKGTTWEQAGHNPEFNEARLREIREFLQGADVLHSTEPSATG